MSVKLDRSGIGFPNYDPRHPAWSRRFDDPEGKRQLLYYLRQQLDVLTLDIDKCSLILMYLELRARFDDKNGIASIVRGYLISGMTCQIRETFIRWVQSWERKLKLYRSIRPVVTRLEFNYLIAIVLRVDLPIFFSDREVEFAILLTAINDGPRQNDPPLVEIREACDAFHNAWQTDRGRMTWDDWRKLLVSLFGIEIAQPN